MSLNDAQTKHLMQMLQEYKAAGMNITTSDGEVCGLQEFDQKRVDAIFELKPELMKFVEGKIGLREFKEGNESLCRKHDYWGFKNFSGQMYLNQLTNWSEANEDMAKLMRRSFIAPKSSDEAVRLIDDFQAKITEILPQGTKRIRKRSTPFLLSYFWQLQEPMTIPMHFAATNTVFEDLAILNGEESVASAYQTYWNACVEIGKLFTSAMPSKSGNSLWFAEHVFYFICHRGHANQKQSKPEFLPELKSHIQNHKNYRSYLPPAISDLETLGQDGTTALDYERKVGLAFKLLGFELEQMGQGKGRNPDGIAYLRELNFALLFDAKAANDGYGLGQEDRKFIEYIQTHQRRLRKDGYTKLVFVVVSNGFKGNPKDAISRIKRDADVHAVRMISTEQLVKLIAAKISDPLQFDSQLPEMVSLLLDENGAIEDSGLDDFLAPFEF